MTTYADCTTKVEKVNFMKQMVATSDRWMLKALLTIYKYQTAQEQASQTTQMDNGVGFTGVDGTILSSFAEQLIRRGVPALLESKEEVNALRFLSPKQVPLLRKKMPKYAKQLVQIADSAKVVQSA